VWYHTNLREDRTALSVLARSNVEREQVADVLEECNPLDLHDETSPGIGGATRISPEVQRSDYAAPTSDQMRIGAAGTSEQTEQVIPVVKEELAVGKRASERRYRIRTYVVETPAEEQVKLQDERVIVERRPASGTVGSDVGTMQERVFEVTERHEEPVVEKRARESRGGGRSQRGRRAGRNRAGYRASDQSGCVPGDGRSSDRGWRRNFAEPQAIGERLGLNRFRGSLQWALCWLVVGPLGSRPRSSIGWPG
jgi:hypothetical protein